MQLTLNSFIVVIVLIVLFVATNLTLVRFNEPSSKKIRVGNLFAKANRPVTVSAV